MPEILLFGTLNLLEAFDIASFLSNPSAISLSTNATTSFQFISDTLVPLIYLSQQKLIKTVFISYDALILDFFTFFS